jgi:diguanylate cyclase (GGDEF)-like protein
MEQQVDPMSGDDSRPEWPLERGSRDPLTGLLSRRAVDAELARLDPGDVVVMVDPDHLGRVNEQSGRGAGDLTLRSLAACLADFCRRDDWCARYGDDELLLVVRHSGSMPSRAVDRLRERWQALQPRTTFSAGVAVHRQNTDPWVTVSHAVTALRTAKAAGRDRVEVYPGDSAGV